MAGRTLTTRLSAGKSQSLTAAGDHSLSRHLNWLAGREIAVGLAFLAVSLLSIMATRAPGGVALMWPGNAIAAAVLIRLPRVRWFPAMGALFVAGILANWVAAGDAWGVALGFSVVNLFEIGAMVVVFRYLIRYPYPHITILQASVMTLVMGFAITAATALLGSALLHQALGASFWPTARGWWMANALGACLFAPPIILYSRERLVRLVQHRRLATNVLLLLGCILATGLAVRYVQFPFVVFALLPLAAAFHVGSFGTAVLGLCNALTVVGLWTMGIQPHGLDPAVHGTALDALPFIALLAAVMPPIAVGLGTDDRRHTARALRASEQRFRESMEHSPLGVVMLDLAGRKVFANEALHRMLGYSDAELQEMGLESLAHPNDLQDLRERLRQLIARQVEFYTIERRFRHAAGTWIWAHCAVSLARDENGTPMHFIAQVESLEERRRAEAQVVTERELLRTTLASIADAVITTDMGGAITYMNDAAVALTGRRFETVEQQHLVGVLGLIEAECPLPAENLFERCVREQRVVRRSEPCILQRPDGGMAYICESITPVFDETLEMTSIVVVLHDMTEARERTRDLHRQANHDPLTGLLNRAAFERQLQQSFARGAHSGGRAALIAIDLDKFKAVNDSGGHAAGDEVLRHVAAVLRQGTRSTDAIGRLGGDEFAVLLNECDASQSADIAQRLLASLNLLRTSWNGAVLETGASLGLAQWDAGVADTQQWVAAADGACYAAKRAGRGTMVCWTPVRQLAAG
jgi:diguanylate cyclase